MALIDSRSASARHATPRLKKLSYPVEICSNLDDALAGRIADDHPPGQSGRRQSGEPPSPLARVGSELSELSRSNGWGGKAMKHNILSDDDAA
jgi:hypothetical protein